MATLYRSTSEMGVAKSLQRSLDELRLIAASRARLFVIVDSVLAVLPFLVLVVGSMNIIGHLKSPKNFHGTLTTP
eukprot:10929342-Ditylum_brightwellii.AAC.1